MKTINSISKFLLLSFILMLSSNLVAQDVVKVASNEYKKVVLNNENVRVIEVQFAPGATAAWHSHPAHVVYVIAGGKLEMTEKGKKPVIRELKTGEASYNLPVTHMVKNVGKTTVKLILTELKPATHKMMKMESMNSQKQK
jgi:quercetin dioxygenase-like cupin family protein